VSRSFFWAPVSHTNPLEVHNRQNLFKPGYRSSLRVRLCQASWCDPAVRSHVGRLGGALAYSVALLALQLLAVRHTGDRIPGRSTWGSPTMSKRPWTPEGSKGARGLLSVPYRLPVVSIVPASSPDGSLRAFRFSCLSQTRSAAVTAPKPAVGSVDSGGVKGTRPPGYYCSTAVSCRHGVSVD
jgi:hypothetical protein